MDTQDTIRRLEEVIAHQKITISQISHEVRNPVTLINSSLQLIEKEHPEVQEFAFWKDTRADMQYLLRLLDEVSHYNNGETLHPEEINTSQWLLDLMRFPGPFLSAHHRFLYEIPASLPTLKADPTKLRQAISNLLRNAFEALDTDGEVTFTASVEENHLSLIISDTGCGIPEEYRETLFQPFVTHKSTGTGLGLSITKRIIEAHGGTLSLQTQKGQGTVFTILLPL